jgi:hypothetical protein
MADYHERITKDEWTRNQARYIELCDEYGEAKTEIDAHDLLKDIVIAEEMQKAEENGVGSAAGQMRDAKASPRYRKHVEDRKGKSAVVNYLFGRRKAAEIWFDWARTLESTLRAEMQLAR